MLFECHFFSGNYIIYLNTTENSLTHKSLHTTTKKTHSLQSKRQIILCLPRNYCLAIHETALKSIFSADRELSVKMRGLIMYMFPPSHKTLSKTLYLRSFCLLFSTRLWTRPSLLTSFSRIEPVCITNKVRNSRIVLFSQTESNTILRRWSRCCSSSV